MFYITNVIADKDEYIIFGYDEENKRRIIREPFVFDIFKRSDSGGKLDIFGHKFEKITCSNDDQRKSLIKELDSKKDTFKQFFSEGICPSYAGNVPPHSYYLFHYFLQNNLLSDEEELQKYIHKTNSKMRKFFIDIEFEGDSELDNLEASRGVINIITIFDSKSHTALVYGLREWKEDKDYKEKSKEWGIKKTFYKKFETEKELISAVADTFSKLSPDVVTGWFSNGYDMPMILLRAKEYGIKLHRFSPINKRSFITSREFQGKKKYSFGIGGIHFIDYLELYKKIKTFNLTSFGLNNISEIELGDKKLQFNQRVGQDIQNDFNSFAKNDWNNFVKYNIKDVVLVYKLDKKLDYLNRALNMTMSGCGLMPDVMSPIKIWDNLNYTYFLKEDRIVNSPVNFEDKRKILARDYLAGYVKTEVEGLKPGLYRNVVSFDLNSEYPTINISFDMSYENQLTHLDVSKHHHDVYRFFKDNIEPMTEKQFWYDYFNHGGVVREFQSLLKKENLIYTSNSVFWKRTPGDELGFVSRIYKKFYDKRVETKHRLATEPNLTELEEGLLGGLQLKLKDDLNAGTGIHASPYYRYFNVDYIESITTTGRLLINYTSDKISKFLYKHFKAEYNAQGIGDDNIDDICIYNDTDSVGKDSLISINGKNITIEDYYNRVKEVELIKRGEDNFIKKLDGKDKSPSVNNSELIIEENSVKYIMKHKVKKRMYRIKTKDKEVMVTEDHSVMVLRDGKLIGIKIKDRQKNDKLIVKKEKKINENYEIIEDYEVEYLGIVEDYVYDVEIENNHNFFANDILVHNSCYMWMEPIFNSKKINQNMDKFKKFVDVFVQKEIDSVLDRFAKDWNCKMNYFGMKRELICESALWVAGKNYICDVINDEGKEVRKYKMKGVNLVKKTTNPIIADKIKDEALKFIFDNDIEGLNEWLINYKKEFKKLPLSVLASAIGMKAEINQYLSGKGEPIKGTPRHVKGAIKYNNILKDSNIKNLPKISTGGKVNVIYMKPEFGENCLAFVEDYPHHIEIFQEISKMVDYDTLFEKQVIANLNQLLKPLGRRITDVSMNNNSLF